MNEFLITILMVNYNCADFTLNNLYCLKKLTKNKFKVIIRDNYSKIGDYLKLKKYIVNYPNIELYRVENFNYKGSTAHGIAINELMERIDTKYGVICDPDCTFLIKHWDEILINQINEKYPIIGTQASIGGNKPIDFPHLYAIFFYTEILKKLKINFKPKDVFKKGQDTGFEIRDKFLSLGYKGKILKNKYTLTYKSGPFCNLLCQEFYLDGYNEIIASHFFKGSTIGDWKYYQKMRKYILKIPLFGNYLFTYVFKPEVLSFIAKFRGRSEKNKWIKICRKIVNSQT